MLTIRNVQLEILEQAARASARDRLTAEIRDHLPDHYAALGESGVRAAIEDAVPRARNYGLVSAAGVTVFVRFMMIFGLEFDDDPKLSWARQILESSHYSDEGAKIGALVDAVRNYLTGLERNE